jgi:hypothetical protein
MGVVGRVVVLSHGLLYERVEEIGCIRDLLGGVTVIRLQTLL